MILSRSNGDTGCEATQRTLTANTSFVLAVAIWAVCVIQICKNTSPLEESRNSRSKRCLATDAQEIQTDFNRVGDGDVSVIT